MDCRHNTSGLARQRTAEGQPARAPLRPRAQPRVGCAAACLPLDSSLALRDCAGRREGGASHRVRAACERAAETTRQPHGVAPVHACAAPRLARRHRRGGIHLTRAPERSCSKPRTLPGVAHPQCHARTHAKCLARVRALAQHHRPSDKKTSRGQSGLVLDHDLATLMGCRRLHPQLDINSKRVLCPGM